jgi:hypothetical protein
MGHTIKGQSPGKYRSSATRRPSGLSPIPESPERALRRWNQLRQAVKRRSQMLRNQQRTANLALLRQVRELNAATAKEEAFYKSQMTRLENQARNLGALGDPNFLDAKRTQRAVYKKHLAQLHRLRNRVVDELVRNSTSSAIRRKLYANGIKRGRHGTSQNNWQNWTNKLWHETEQRARASQFFTPKK